MTAVRFPGLLSAGRLVPSILPKPDSHSGLFMRGRSKLSRFSVADQLPLLGWEGSPHQKRTSPLGGCEERTKRLRCRPPPPLQAG